jgi:hypothetical protein
MRILGVTASSVRELFAQYLVIAGGGPGGVAVGSLTNTGTGGGGAGGYLTAAGVPLQLGTLYTITVGAGASSNGLEIGSNSVFGSITAFGGGGGGSPSAPNGKSGGSGGGAGYHQFGTSGEGSGTPGQGFAGGSRSGEASGGGGGAGGVGGSTSNNTPGTQGPGLASSITGTSVTRATGGRGNWSNGGVTVLDGGANTGEGGWGGVNNRASSAWGGSGVVILRYPSSFTISGGAGLVFTTNPVGNDKVTVFTGGTGTISW